MALPVKCVKWDAMELTAKQVTLMATAACLYRPACQGGKVAMSQLSGGMMGGKKCPQTCETGEQLAGHLERHNGSEHLWSARRVAPLFLLKRRHGQLCHRATQTTERRDGWSVPELLAWEGTRGDTPVAFSLGQLGAQD